MTCRKFHVSECGVFWRLVLGVGVGVLGFCLVSGVESCIFVGKNIVSPKIFLQGGSA